MPYIAGLDERKAALIRIKQNIGEIIKINDSVSDIKTLTDDSEKKAVKLSYEFTLNDGTLKRLKIPIVIEDNDFVIDAVKKYKRNIIQSVKDDAEKYDISLTEQEVILIGDK